MKKLTVLVSVVLVAVFMLTAATDAKKKKKKKSWKGTNTYSISYDGEDVTPASVANAPKTTRVKVMGDKNAAEVIQMGATQTFVTNPEFDLFMLKLEFGDKKYAIKQKLSEVRSKQDSAKKFDINVDLVNETKTIAGYECKKAVVTFTPLDTADGEEQIFNYYYSEDLGNEDTNKGDDFEKIPGMLLEYSLIQGGMIISYQATEVKKGGVGDADFLVPVDFKVVTEEELMEELSQ